MTLSMTFEIDFPVYSKFLKERIGQRSYRKLMERVERVTCKVAPYQESTGNTQTKNRWEINPEDRQYSSEKDCIGIAEILLADISKTDDIGDIPADAMNEVLSNIKEFNIANPLKCFKTGIYILLEDITKLLSISSRIGSAEVPIDYIDNSAAHIHYKGNIAWFAYPEILIKLREFYRDKSSLVEKVQTKAYLTDRRQTGDYPTNRELRWETNNSSPQYATRRDAMEIEAKLLGQAFEFDDAPEPGELLKDLPAVLGGSFNGSSSFRCPITGGHIRYQWFLADISQSRHGRSRYQVGHLAPISQAGTHTAHNISWITELGNRIQGESSLNEIVEEIFKMAVYHKEDRNLEWEEVEKIAKNQIDT